MGLPLSRRIVFSQLSITGKRVAETQKFDGPDANHKHDTALGSLCLFRVGNDRWLPETRISRLTNGGAVFTPRGRPICSMRLTAFAEGRSFRPVLSIHQISGNRFLRWWRQARAWRSFRRVCNTFVRTESASTGYAPESASWMWS